MRIQFDSTSPTSQQTFSFSLSISKCVSIAALTICTCSAFEVFRCGTEDISGGGEAHDLVRAIELLLVGRKGICAFAVNVSSTPGCTMGRRANPS